jgi:hypothetical protein
LRSNYKDFYDSLIHQSGDDGLEFVRIHKKEWAEIPNPYVRYAWDQNYRDHDIIVGFCDQIYQGRVVGITSSDTATIPRYECIWGIDKILRHRKIDPDSKTWIRNAGNGNWGTNRERYIQEVESWRYLFQKYGPIWLVDPWLIHIHPILDRWQFAKVLSPQEAFFAVRQWVISQHRPEKEIPIVSDETMAEIKGFDPKSAFRRDKGQGPKRKRSA